MRVSLLLQFVVGSPPKWRRMTGLLRPRFVRYCVSCELPYNGKMNVEKSLKSNL